MKTKLIISFLVVALFISSSSVFAQRSYEMQLLNIVQLNETAFRFDVRFRNTAADPVTNYIAVEMMQFQVRFNTAMLNGGAFNNLYFTFIPGSSDLVGVNLPTSSRITTDQTVIQWGTPATNQYDFITLINNNNWVRVGTFQAVLKTSSTLPAYNKNFASVLPNLTLEPTGVLCNWCTYIDLGSGPQRASSDFQLITNKTLTNPTVNKPLYGYAFSGTGSYSSAANWNIAVSSTGSGYQTSPSTNTDNISIGYFTTATAPVVVPGLCTINDANKTIGDLTINAGSQLTLNSGITTTTANVYINSDGTSGTGTFVDLNPTGGLTVNGTTNVQQYVTSGRNWYVSSPLTSAPTSIVTGTTGNSLWNYTEANTGTVIWNPITTGNFGVTTGYVANVAASGNINFTGSILNTGPLTILTTTLTRTGILSQGFNLVGNPYPSYLNWISAVASTNTGTTNMEPTIWYRSKNPSATYVFDTFIANGSGGGIGTTNFSGGTTAVTGFIAPMQAFWARVVAGQTSGTLAFDNTMRAHQDQSVTTNRLKVRTVTNETQQLLRLQASNGINSDEAIVYFNPNASDGFDAYDSEKMSNNNDAIPEIYTLAGEEQVVINGLKSVYNNEELPLGFNTRKVNTFTIKATEMSNFDESTQIILKDKLLNTEQELESNTAYTFTSDPVNTTSRFSIVFKTISRTTGLNFNTGSGSETFFVFQNLNNQITIHRNDAIGEGIITVCNAIGQKLVSQSTTGTVTVVEKGLLPGVYLVTVDVAGKGSTQRVVLKN